MSSIIKDDEILAKIKRLANTLGDKVLIVSRPDSAKSFLGKVQRRVAQTKVLYSKLVRQVKTSKHITHEVENLLDNYYIISGAIADILNSPVKTSFKKLVLIEKTPRLFIPRIYSILTDLLRASDYKVSRILLQEFLQAYQGKAHLSIRELSFVPFVLKIILIENIENVMHRSIVSLDEFTDAEYWFGQIVKKGEKNLEQYYSKLTASMAAKYGVIPANLSFHLLQKLSQYGPDTRPIVKWLKSNLLKQGIDITDLGEIESRRQNESSILISNIIDSLRWINQARWDDFVVSVNTVDTFLQKDPANSYDQLDQMSQNTYRNEVVKIGDRTGVHESEIAKLAVRLAQHGIHNHVGYYLVGDGRAELDQKIGYKKTIGEKLRTLVLKHAPIFYLGGILLINVILTILFTSILPAFALSIFTFSILTAFIFILNFDVTLNIVNLLINFFIPVRSLFRLDLSKGVSTKQSTFVVIPSMFRDERGAQNLLRRLEVNYLGNQTDNVFFALLMDFKDSKNETELSDQILVDQVKLGIEKLNQKYPGAVNKFYLFHRKRIWNAGENVFMGWERKRGKLQEFNKFLRDGKNLTYFENLPADLPSIKYILTIDEDTRLPKDSAIKLIGSIDHPLNRPVVDSKTHKVVSGYGIIQPRMTTKFRNARATAFSRLYSSAMGVDSYSGPVADVYQDLFNNSLFYGKGIYDVDAMEATIADAIPENQVLSHDLLEGLYTRVGFATDIFLFEGFPLSYKEYILRMHRWIRGDWQIVTWLWSGAIKNTNFSVIDKWKIFDNLRRSTVPILSFLFLAIVFLFTPTFSALAFLYIFLVVGSSFIISYLFRLFQWPHELTLWMKINSSLEDLDEVIIALACRFIFLLDQAVISLRAIVISTYRMLVSRKYLLRWQNSHEVAKNLRGTFGEFLYLMSPTVIISALLLVLARSLDFNYYLYTSAILWLVSPVVAYNISRSKKGHTYKPDDVKLLRSVACRSARYFLDFSNKDSNFLIPDHHQEEPVTNSQASTSPTNIGMHLLSIFSAYDLGYISFSNLIERLGRSFKSLELLERYEGHFYNWYDIRSLQSLTPKYVSSVDSANLLLALLTLKQGLLDVMNKPFIGPQSVNGLKDVLRVMIEDADLIAKSNLVRNAEKRLARNIISRAKSALSKLGSLKIEAFSPVVFAKTLDHLSDINEKIKKSVSHLNLPTNKDLQAIYSSADHLDNLIRDQKNEGSGHPSSLVQEEGRRIISLCEKFFTEVNFSFLYNKERGLFHIGYNVTFDKIDNSYYDFLASEANSISFVSIIKNQVPLKHWSYLGRKLVRLDGKNVLLSSWGGSLFEYLTSLIFFRVHEESLLGQTAKVAIESHIKYGQAHRVPWGMGESAYNALDLNNNYQYQIFGHPSIGLRRGLQDFLVVAPYSTIMSLSFKPKQAIQNLRKLIKSKLLRRYGFYDAVDYTGNSKTKFSRAGSIAKIYYAHHQGFSLQALNNEINPGRIRSLFLKDPRVEAVDTLLEEKLPSSIPEKPIKNLEHIPVEYLTGQNDETSVKQYIPIFTSYPRRAFLSNGSYQVQISNTGAGGSKTAEMEITRFREDTVVEPWGQFIYLRDTVKGDIWSPTTQPTGISSGKNKIEHFENKVRFNKIINDIESSLSVSVAADSDAEFRSLTLTNHGKEKRYLDVTSYGEVSLSKTNHDLHHTAFEKLFVKSEFWKKYNALVYHKRHPDERGASLYFAHKVVGHDVSKAEPVFMADREHFIGRGGTNRTPQIFSSQYKKIKPGLGYNFDPIFSFQNKIELAHNETITLTYINIFAKSEEELTKNLKKYSSSKNIHSAVKKSDKQGYDIIRSLGLTQDQALHYQGLASRLLSPHYAHEVKKFAAGSELPAVETLWRLGVSGDWPILVVKFYDMNDLAMVKNLLMGYKYLQYKGVVCDLVFLNEYPASYNKSFEDEVDFLIRYNQAQTSLTAKGKVFHLRTSYMSEGDKATLLSLAKVTLDSKLGPIEQQILSLLQSSSKTSLKYLEPVKKAPSSGRDLVKNISTLPFYNNLGAFKNEGQEYVMNINYKKDSYTPKPWTNIIANQNIGSVITESGAMYSWLFDSYDDRLTRRIDDSLTDRSSEIFYVRDEENGEFWNPTPLPIQSSHTYSVSHGLGYTRFEHKSRGLEQTMLAYVPVSDSIKIFSFKFKNTSKTAKKLSLTGFWEMSLGGANREDTKDYLQTFKDTETGATLVKNIYGASFKNVWAFADLNGGDSVLTNDRDEFLGKNGEVANPAALRREKLSNEIHDDVDHCVALQTFFEILPGEEREITALLGGGHSVEEVKNLVHKYRTASQTQFALGEVRDKWENLQNKIQIKTPDESLNILFNSRLLYQLVSSRLLARTGYYQPSGAYGFRDQLQDSLALVWSAPEMTKEMIRKAARHQFEEGDVQTWWHEHNSFGVRRICSDQQLWLPYALASYLEVTGDKDLLTEKENYVKAPLLDFGGNSTWAGVPEVSTETYDLYDHAIRAIEKTLLFGKNGLPLIGNGDWNDGLNKVGERGLGESVWLGWFLYFVLDKFVPFIEGRGDTERVTRYKTIQKNLKKSLEKNAWDGKWYKRAFFDTGVPLGSRRNAEFKIDSVAQSWAVLSGAARLDRATTAMESVNKNLFQDQNLLLLLGPAVKDSTIDPGYIRDYPPGVRENGAQYNHAALWTVQAFAQLKNPLMAMKVLDSINPIKRSLDKEAVSTYKVEPYVVASDIYAKPSEAGRGGWTWYTGSAGVMYRTILENILGLKVRGNKMEIDPCIPAEWPSFEVAYTYKSTKYDIHVLNNKEGKASSQKHFVDLVDDGGAHVIEFKL